MNRPTKWENIHKHDMLSNLVVPDSTAQPHQYLERYKELGMTAYSLCNHGILMNYGVAYDLAVSNGLKPIFAVEAYIYKDRTSERMNHQLIIAKNNEGRKELNRLLSYAWENNFYNRRNPIYLEDLLNLNKDNFIITTTCIDSFLSRHGDEAVEWYLEPVIEHFGKENVYIEMQYHDAEIQAEYNRRLLKYKEKYGLKLFFASDSHYVYEHEKELRTLFQQSKGVFYDDDHENTFWLDVPSIDMIYDRFAQQGVLSEEEVTEAILSTTEIVERCEDIILNKDIKMPTLYPDKTHEQKLELLKKVIIKEWNKEKVNIDPSLHKLYSQEILREFAIIQKTAMEDYFLFNYNIVQKAKNDYNLRLTRTGRGSAVSFYLNKLFGFTDIDRIASTIQMYPERFMSIERILETVSLPDIDFNMVEDEPIVQASKDILGEEHVYPMIALGTLKDSSAWQVYGRAYNIPPKTLIEVSKNIDDYRSNPDYAEMIEKSEDLQGVVDSVSIHPCAYLLYPEDIKSEVGLIKTIDTNKVVRTLALIDSYYSDVYKFLKNDYLKVTVYKIIYGVADKTEPVPSVKELLEFANSEEGKGMWKIYEDGMTVTLNQVSTDSAVPQVMWYKPKTIAELSHFVAGIRPSFKSMKQKLFDREEFSYGIPEFDKLLETSDNFILYQENIMAVLQYAGFPAGESYGLLKQIAKKKGNFELIKQRFYDGFMNASGLDVNEVSRVWQIIEDSVGYGFNSSHSYSVSVDSLYGAYYKYKYPAVYFSVIMEQFKKKPIFQRIVGELKYFGLEHGSLKFGVSRSSYFSIDNVIYRGTSSVKSVSGTTGDRLYEIYHSTKDIESMDFVDLLMLLDEHKISKAEILKLIYADYFSMYGGSQYLKNVWVHYYGEVKPTEGQKPFKVFGIKEKGRPARLESLREILSGMDKEEQISDLELIRNEYEMFGQLDRTYEKFTKRDFLVVDTLTKYTNAIVKIQSIRSGKITEVTVRKRYFYDENKKARMKKGDIIRVQRVANEEINHPVEQNGETKWIPSGTFKNFLYTWGTLKVDEDK